MIYDYFLKSTKEYYLSTTSLFEIVYFLSKSKILSIQNFRDDYLWWMYFKYVDTNFLNIA